MQLIVCSVSEKLVKVCKHMVNLNQAQNNHSHTTVVELNSKYKKDVIPSTYDS